MALFFCVSGLKAGRHRVAKPDFRVRFWGTKPWGGEGGGYFLLFLTSMWLMDLKLVVGYLMRFMLFLCAFCALLGRDGAGKVDLVGLVDG